jgi:hypothetical protein
MNISTVSQEMVEHVKAHALAHYNDGGWDVIVECWEDKEIVDWLTDPTMPAVTTNALAIERMFILVEIWADRQADARNSAF